MWRAEEGFTLLEAIVALLIVGLAVVPILATFAPGLRSQAQVEATLEAVALAETRMSALALLPPDSLAAYGEVREGGFPPPFERYRWRALLRSEAGRPALVRGAVLVEWGGGEYLLETVFHRPELLPRWR